MATPPAPAHTAPYALHLDGDEVNRYERMASRAWRSEEALWALAGFVGGARVADVGCGPGAVLRLLAAAVGPGGEAIGVEPDPGARELATRAVQGMPQARVIAGEGARSGLPDGALDAVMVRHVLFHCGAGVPGIVAHLATRLRPGGHLYLVDTDLGAARVTPPHPDIADEHRRYVKFQRLRGNDVLIARRLDTLLAGAGLDVVLRRATVHTVAGPELLVHGGGPARAARPRMLAAGMIGEADTARWDAAWAELRRARRHLELRVPQVIAIGRRPAI